MSSPETNGDVGLPAVVTYLDGRTERVARMDRPAVLVRLERAYPDVEFGADRSRMKAEHLFFMAFTALRLDPETAVGVGEDFDAWLDTVAEVDTDGPPAPAAPAEPRASKRGAQAAR